MNQACVRIRRAFESGVHARASELCALAGVCAVVRASVLVYSRKLSSASMCTRVRACVCTHVRACIPTFVRACACVYARMRVYSRACARVRFYFLPVTWYGNRHLAFNKNYNKTPFKTIPKNTWIWQTMPSIGNRDVPKPQECSNNARGREIYTSRLPIRPHPLTFYPGT